MSSPAVGSERLEAIKIREEFGDALTKVCQKFDETYLCIRREKIADVIQFLKDDADLAYDYFVECLGVDYLTWKGERDVEGRFEVVYNLYSTKNLSRIYLKVGVDDGESVPTAKHVFLGAEFPEREIWDLFGVVFEGNQHSGRFLLPDNWKGHPLRKDEPLGGEDVVFAQGTEGPAVEDESTPHAGESFEGETGSEKIGGR